MDSSTYNIISLIIQGLVALGTIAVAIIAIWGELLRIGPKLEIKLENHKGCLHGNTIYYQLKIINKRSWVLAKNVRILCAEISKKRPDGSFTPETMLYPIPLKWAPAEFTNLDITFATEALCDLGNVSKGSSNFNLAARYFWTINFPGILNANDAMRIRLNISSFNFISKIPFDIEIAWDGIWSDNLEDMTKHLIIRQVNIQNHAH